MALVAAAIRLAYVAATADVPFVRNPVGDAAGYLDWASRIAAGQWLGTEVFYQAPLYPYLIAIMKVLGAESVQAVRYIQCVFGGASVWLLGSAAALLFGRRAAILTAAGLALYPPAIFFDGIIQKTSPALLLTCAVIYCAARASVHERSRSLFMTGFVLGLCILVRENALIWIPVVAAWAALAAGRYGLPSAPTQSANQQGGWGNTDAETASSGHRTTAGRRVRALAVVAVLAGAALPLSIVAARNAYVGGTFATTTSQGGTNFYIGNRAGADGRYHPLVPGRETPAFERVDATRLAEAEAGRSLSPSEVSRYWYGKAMADIAADPMRWGRLMLRKTLLAISAYEIADAESPEVYFAYAGVPELLPQLWHFGILFPLAAAGVVAALRERNAERFHKTGMLLLLALTTVMWLAVAAFYVMARYRFPLVPLLMPFAAVGALHLFDCWRKRTFDRTAAPLAVLILAAVVSNVRLVDEEALDAMGYMNAGVAHAKLGEMDPAIVMFDLAVSIAPQSPEAHLNLAQALAQQQRFSEAIPHFEFVIHAKPDLPGLWYNAGVCLEKCERLSDALRAYEEALRHDPTDQDALRAIERIRAKHDRAVEGSGGS